MSETEWGVRHQDPSGRVLEWAKPNRETAMHFVDTWKQHLPDYRAELIHRTPAGPWLDDDGTRTSVVAEGTVHLTRRKPADIATYHADRVAAMLEDPSATDEQIRVGAVAALIGLRMLAAELAGDEGP